MLSALQYGFQLIGLVFCCLGVWMIIVTTNNIELAPRNQVVFELHPAPPMSSFSSTGNGPPAPSSVHNTAVSSGDRSTISTQSSLDTSSVYLTASSASSSSSSSSTSSTHPGTSGSSSSWPSQSISASKGPSGRKPPFMNHTGPKKLIPLANYHNYLLCLGILSICVGFVRALASSFLLWNSVEKVGHFSLLSLMNVFYYNSTRQQGNPEKSLAISWLVKGNMFLVCAIWHVSPSFPDSCWPSTVHDIVHNNQVKAGFGQRHG